MVLGTDASAAGEAPKISTGPRVEEILECAVEGECEGERRGGPSSTEFMVGVEASGGDDIVIENSFEKREDTAPSPVVGRARLDPS